MIDADREADTSERDLRAIFRSALNAAIVSGAVPTADLGLGPRSMSALEAIATAHPDAAAELIAAASEVFSIERSKAATAAGQQPPRRSPHATTTSTVGSAAPRTSGWTKTADQILASIGTYGIQNP